MGPVISHEHHPATGSLASKGWRRWVPSSIVIAVCIAALGILFARAPFTLCLAVVLGIIGGILLLLRPTIGLYVLAFAIPFGSLYELHIAGLTVGASELLVLSITAAWLLRMMATRKVAFARSKLALAILLYAGAVALSLWPAQEMLSAFKALAKWVEFLLLYLFVASELERTDRRILVASLLLAGTLEGALGIYQFVRQVGPPGFVLFDRYMRAYGTFLQPNPFGGYLGLLLPTAYATAITVWQDLLAKPSVPGTGQKRSPWLLSLGLLAIISALVMGIALIMSWSRGALLGLVGGFVMISLALRRRAWVAIAIAALFLVLISPLLSGIIPTDFVGRVKGLAEYVGQDLTTVEITDDNFAVIERVAHWQAAWRMFTMRPWLGVGSGQYATVYPTVAVPRWQDPLGHAHNYYLNVLAEGGLVGLATYLIMLLAATITAWRAARRERGWRLGLALGGLGMLGHLLTHSLFDNLYVHEMYLLVAILLGIVVSLSNQDPSQAKSRSDWQSDLPASSCKTA